MPVRGEEVIGLSDEPEVVEDILEDGLSAGPADEGLTVEDTGPA